MTISAKMICDSVSEAGIRICTVLLRYPLSYHAELLTHRVFSRNAASSRAIPVAKIMQMIEEEPVMPLKWLLNKPGMQGGDEMTSDQIAIANEIWNTHRQQTLQAMEALTALGVHKQYANRLAAPHQHINVLVTSTDWENFFNLRDHSDAQPEMMVLAQEIKGCIENSVPTLKRKNEWHLPFIEPEDIKRNLSIEDLRKVSVARCARLSYQAFDGKVTTLEQDLELCKKLFTNPFHASPFEHQASPDELTIINSFGGATWKNPNLQGNFTGWIQYRKLFKNESSRDGKYHGVMIDPENE